MNRGLRAGAGREALGVGALVAVAGLIRWIRWSQTAVLFNDGPEFLKLAKAMALGEWGWVFSHQYHPLYPFLTRVAHFAIDSWESAAVAVSIAAGGASVAFLYLFLRESFGPAAAWGGAALLAVQRRAVDYSSDVQSDGLYLALFLAALWLLWRALRSGSTRLAAACGVLIGLAYLTRPEALALAVSALALLGIACLQGRQRLAACVPWAAALAAGTLLLAAPYVLAMHDQSGVWTLTQKKSVSSLVGLAVTASPRAPAAPHPEIQADVVVAPSSPPGGLGNASAAAQPSLLRRLASTTRLLLRKTGSAFRMLFMVAIVPGLIVCRGRPGRRASFILIVIAVHAVLLFFLAFNLGYVSRRHILPPLVPLFGYVALGLPVLGGWFAAPLRALLPDVAWLRRAGALAILGFLPVALISLGNLAEPRREESFDVRHAAEWLRENREDVELLATSRRRTAYYTGARFCRIPAAVPDRIIAHAQACGARYMIVDASKFAAGASMAEQAGIRLLHRESAFGTDVEVYELVSVGRESATGSAVPSDPVYDAKF